MVSHAFLTPPSAFDLESHDEERLGGWRTRALRSQVLGIAQFARATPFADPGRLAMLQEGLLKAGLPE